MIKITYKLILLLSLLAMTVTSFAASEAEYGKVSKAWTLHADGSQEYRSSMELTLFTHTAMNSTYGESFIVYNPDFQTLKIHSSYTRQKDGTIVKTPDNAFVEVLPRFAADAPAYNQLNGRGTHWPRTWGHDLLGLLYYHKTGLLSGSGYQRATTRDLSREGMQGLYFRTGRDPLGLRSIRLPRKSRGREP